MNKKLINLFAEELTINELMEALRNKLATAPLNGHGKNQRWTTKHEQREMRRLRKLGKPLGEIAETIGVSYATVSNHTKGV